MKWGVAACYRMIDPDFTGDAMSRDVMMPARLSENYSLFRRRATTPSAMTPKVMSEMVPGSGTTLMSRLKSPVDVPAVVRLIAEPIVSEYGLAVGTKLPELVPE